MTSKLSQGTKQDNYLPKSSSQSENFSPIATAELVAQNLTNYTRTSIFYLFIILFHFYTIFLFDFILMQVTDHLGLYVLTFQRKVSTILQYYQNTPT